MKPNKILYVKCADGRFFRTWVEFLTPYHKLTARERDVMARIISQYFKLRKSVSDPSLLNEMLWTQASRKDMRESLGMSPAHFQMILGKLHQAGVLREDDSIEPRYIPDIVDDEPRFLLNVIFDWSSPTKPING